jgi:hypothetical protein
VQVKSTGVSLHVASLLVRLGVGIVAMLGMMSGFPSSDFPNLSSALRGPPSSPRQNRTMTVLRGE